MERFILLCVILCSSQQEDTGCPTTVTLWKEKEAEFNCAMNKFYHCLRDEKQQTVQTCLERSWVQPGFCPEFNSIANEIDVFLCKESLGKCPEATFWSNELHKYSACLNATNTGNKISTKSKQEEKKDEKDVITIPIVTSVSALVVIVASVAITVLCCRRKKMSKQRNKATELKGMKDTDTTAGLLHLEDERPIGPDDRNRNERFSVMTDSSDRRRKYNFQEVGVMKKTMPVYSCEEIDTVLEKHLHYPGDKLVMVYDTAEQVPIITAAVKSKFPRFIKIEDFNDWSGTTDKEGYSVLLSCVMKELSLAGHLDKFEDKMKDIVLDISKLNLRVVIPLRSDYLKDMEHNQLFKGLNHVRIS